MYFAYMRMNLCMYMYVQLIPNTGTCMYMYMYLYNVHVLACSKVTLVRKPCFTLQLEVLLNARTFTTYWTSLLCLERRRSSV